MRGTRHRIGPDYLEIGSFISLAAVTGGRLLIKNVNHEDLRMIRQVYARLFFVDSLIAMGARIILCDPHRAVVMGPAKLHGSRLSSPDIRAGITMLIAALCAEGESVIQNIGQIDRGFERIDERLRKLGARIERVSLEK